MPFVFGILGVLFVVAGVRGTTSQLVTLIKSEFTGQPNYFEWMIAIFLVGAIGYIDELRTLSRMFMLLLIGGLLWEKRSALTSFVAQDTSTQPVQTTSTVTAPSTGSYIEPAGGSFTTSPLQSVGGGGTNNVQF